MKTNSLKFKVLFICLFPASGMLWAQAPEESEDRAESGFGTIFSSSDSVRVGGFGGPYVGFTMLGNKPALQVGGRGGIILNQNWIFGGYGKTRISLNRWSYDGFNDLRLIDGSGGLFTSYNFNPNDPFNIAFTFNFGLGGTTLTESGAGEPKYSAFFFEAEPILEGRLNLSRFFVISLGAGYRFTYHSNRVGDFSDTDLWGFSAYIGFNFGNFTGMDLSEISTSI